MQPTETVRFHYEPIPGGEVWNREWSHPAKDLPSWFVQRNSDDSITSFVYMGRNDDNSHAYHEIIGEMARGPSDIQGPPE